MRLFRVPGSTLPLPVLVFAVVVAIGWAGGGDASLATGSGFRLERPCSGTVENGTQERVDSVALHREARDAQARFERERVRRAPFTWQGGSGECTEIVGRICLRLGREGDAPDPWELEPALPDEAPELIEARRELLEVLDRVAGAIPGDAWVAGQRVRYRGEADDPDGAVLAAEACRSPEPGWCAGLRGLARLRAGDVRAAEIQFGRALAERPADERTEWLDPRDLVDVELWRELGDLDGQEREMLVERIWRRSDPWLTTGPHELLLEHLGRHVAARIREGTRTPYGLGWGDDLARILVRFGIEAGYERVRESSFRLGPAEVIGRHGPGLRHHFPRPEGVGVGDPEDGPGSRTGILAPATVFTTERSVARSLHRPGSAFRIRDLEAQVARFPRGSDSVAYVVAWRAPRPEPGHPYHEAARSDSVPPPHPGGAEPVLGLQPWDLAPDGTETGLPARVPISRARSLASHRAGGVATGSPGEPRSAADGVELFLGPGGAQLFSLEILESRHGRGWRHRRGLDALTPSDGGLVLSDLLLLHVPGPGEGGTTGEPGQLEDWLPRALPDRRTSTGHVELAWEVHASEGSVQTLEVALRVVGDEGGLLRRLGRALRLLDRPDPPRLSWTESWVPDEGVPSRMSQALRIDLSDLGAGQHEVVLEVTDGTGRTATTRVTVERIEG